MTLCFQGLSSAKYAMRGSPRPYPTQLGCPSIKQASLYTASMSKQGIFEASTYNRRVECQFGEVRNAGQSTAASHSAQLPKRQKSITFDGDCVKIGSLRGVVVTSRFRGTILRIRNARQSAAASHSARCPSIKQASLSTVIVSKQGIFELSS